MSSLEDIREHYTHVPAGTSVWHVYPSVYEPQAFNPHSQNRFAIPPPSGRAIFYAADSSECAVWEAILRNLVVDERQPQHVDPALVEGRSIAQLRLLQETPLLDLRAPYHRHLSVSGSRHDEWRRLSIVPERDYTQTHEAARALLSIAPRAAGLCWYSRQMSAQTVFVFYSPPVSSALFELIRTIPLDQPEGWQLIDTALAVAGVERIGLNALVREIQDELPPEDVEDT